MALQMWIVCVALLGLSTALLCPDGGTCEAKSTCCKDTAGGYGCCPLPHAECCSDHLHCCYEGTICDLVHSTCVNKTVSLPWLRRVPSKQALLVPQLGDRVEAVICPDQSSECPDGTTCCQLRDSSWGCCPLPKAVCCEDRLHCCPEDSQCDVAHSRCLSATLGSVPMVEKVPARRTGSHPVSSVTCPGGTKSCPDTFTCCLLTSGEYGCCPYSKATCCSDHLHCCPENTVCDLEHGACKSGDGGRLPLLRKIPANDVVCPDRTTLCPDQTTCCQMSNGSYGCCPMPDAVCCSDHIHCCPAGTQCDLARSTCDSQSGISPALTISITSTATDTRTRLVAAQLKGVAVPCNDSVACADGNTCCKSPEGEWACCPLPKAVCCEDHLHCCPHGTVCNLAASTCDDPAGGGAVVPWLSRVPPFPFPSSSSSSSLSLSPGHNSRCDKSTSCPGKSTCCRTEGGGWACCPLPQAVCCEDHIHCCAHGTVCNLEAETCDDPAGLLPARPWLEKVPALRPEAQDEKCDKQTMCPGGTTCCKKDSGLWACCPLPQAVCCSDREHCCPKGYKCNVEAQTCDKPGDLSLPWLRKLPARRAQPSGAVSAPARSAENMCDAQTSCPKDTTCCFMEHSHKWGCCPLPKAVCCQDGNHCCPSGHTCEPHRSSCSRGPHRVPWLAKLSASSRPARLRDVKCDDKSSCASGTTCCKLQSGEWGCCPLVKAVCCADHEHCCPQGYTCNMETGTCEKKGQQDQDQEQDEPVLSIPQTRVLQPIRAREATGNGDVVCDASGRFSCPERDTCCQVSAGEWACCPSPRAVCCSDGRHCCPEGFSCDLQSEGCVQQPRWDLMPGDRRRDFVQQGL